MQFLKQSTASQEIQLGPFLDDTDFKSIEDGLTIANTDIQLRFHGGTTHNSKNSGGATHIANGYYYAVLDATDTATVGMLNITVNESGALPVWHDFWVLEEDIYDSLFAASAAGFDSNQRVDLGSWLGTAVTTSSTTTKPEVDAFSISDDATAANNAELDYDGTGYDKSASTIGTCTTNTDMVTEPPTAVQNRQEMDSNSTQLSDIVADTNELQLDDVPGLIGALNDLGTGDIDTQLAAIGLDHLVSASVAGIDVANDSIFAKLVSSSGTADWDDFVNTTDSLQSLRDKLTDIETDTGEIGAAGAGLTNIDLPDQTMDITGSLSGSVGSVTGAVGSVTGAVGSVTGNVGGNVVGSTASVAGNVDGNVTGTVGELAAQAKTDVNAEVSDVLKTDTISELSQGIPAATPTFETAVMLVYMALRDKLDVTSGFKEVHNNAGTVICKKALTDDATTYSEAKMESGP